MPGRIRNTGQEIPEYVKRNLNYWLDVEATDLERAGPVILAMSDRWGF